MPLAEDQHVVQALAPLAEPLIGLEAGRQAAALRRLVSGVTALRALRDRKGVPVVLDTNVLMHYHRPDRVLWAEAIGCAPVRLVLPICVLDELDNKKYADSDRMSRRADMAVRALREHRAYLCRAAPRRSLTVRRAKCSSTRPLTYVRPIRTRSCYPGR